MKVKEMDKFIKHCDTYLEQEEPIVLHPDNDSELHIDVLLYKPSDKYPFWKLVTMGASDYKMPPVSNTIGLYNEYMMFVDNDVDLNDRKIVAWFYDKLFLVSSYAFYNNAHITYGHSMEWENADKEDEMTAAFIEMPQILENVGVLNCKLGLFKTVACLQVVLLNSKELNKLLKIGPQEFSEYLYPENGGKPHYLSEKCRSKKF